VKTTELKKVAESASGILTTRPDDAGALVRPMPSRVAETSDGKECRIALLTPYDGGNLGDASIQDAMIENMRRRLQGVRLSGISLSSEDFLKQHGVESFPLCGTDRPFYRMARGPSKQLPSEEKTSIPVAVQQAVHVRLARKILRRVPFLKAGLKNARAGLKEARHWLASYRFVRTQNLVIVSGGGQLDEEWGGPWGHPFALFKWAMLARIARVPYVMVSVGTCKVRSTTSRLLVSAALRLARYRSFRDKNSRDLAASLLRRASTDPIVPDLAFGLSTSELRQSSSIRLLAADRTVVAISPIAFAKPHNWPQSDSTLYRRYLDQLVSAIAVLLERGYFLVMVSSSRGDDESVIPEIVERLDKNAKEKIEQQIYVPRIATWRDFVNFVSEADFLIASRLHSTILGFISHRPTVAISFDPKVDWVMEDLGQTEYLLHIRDFVAEDVLKAVDRIQLCRAQVSGRLDAYQRQNATVLARQYDSLAELAMDGHRSRVSIQN
jgi:polysaccharide pyruvyl transferase WcaK-like protein